MSPHEQNAIVRAGEILQAACHAASFQAGWWLNIKTGEDTRREYDGKPIDSFSVPEKLCLIHSEVSEGMEGYLKGLRDDKLPHRWMLEVELVDAAVRIFDLAGAVGFNLGEAMVEKLNFNARRPDHQLANRLAADGKKF